MAVSARHLLEQGPVLGALAKAAVGAMRGGNPGGTVPDGPGPTLTRTVRAPSPALVADYVRHVGGDPRAYRGRIPGHLFPQWCFPLQGETLQHLPYDLSKVLNGGCRLELNAPLPAGEPLELEARLESVDDNGRRAVLHTRVSTSTPSVRDAVVAHVFAIVPLPKKPGETREKKKKEPVLAPADAREIDAWSLRANAGLDFALLTGDFNPIHWIPLAGKAAGFKGTILHGFSTMARAYEGLVANVHAGDVDRISVFDVQFVKPLGLPKRVGLFLHGDEVHVADAPGAPSYLKGTRTLSPSSSKEA